MSDKKEFIEVPYVVYSLWDNYYVRVTSSPSGFMRAMSETVEDSNTPIYASHFKTKKEAIEWIESWENAKYNKHSEFVVCRLNLTGILVE